MPPKFLTQQEWLKRVKEKRGNQYDYSKVIYIDSKTPIEIICKKHGSFWQKPVVHMYGANCPLCRKKPRSQEWFKNKIKSFWGENIKKHGYKNIKNGGYYVFYNKYS